MTVQLGLNSQIGIHATIFKEKEKKDDNSEGGFQWWKSEVKDLISIWGDVSGSDGSVLAENSGRSCSIKGT